MMFSANSLSAKMNESCCVANRVGLRGQCPGTRSIPLYTWKQTINLFYRDMCIYAFFKFLCSLCYGGNECLKRGMEFGNGTGSGNEIIIQYMKE